MTKSWFAWSGAVLLAAGIASARDDAGIRPHALTLEECLAAAKETNPSLEAARQRVKAADALWRQARAAWSPVVSTAAGYSVTDNPPQAFMMALNQRALNMQDPLFNPNEPDTTDHLRLALDAKWRVWDGGRRGAGREAAGASARRSAAEEWAVRSMLQHEVTRGYFQALQARAFVEVCREAVKSLDESLRISREKYNAGSALKTDVLNLEVRLAEAQEHLIHAGNQFRIAVAALNTVIGGDWVSEEGPAACDVAVPEAAQAPEKCLARPERAAARLGMDAMREMERAARADYLPVLNAFGSMDWDGEGFRGMERSYMAGVSLEWEIFTGFRRKHAVAAAHAQTLEAAARVREVENGLRLDVVQADAGVEDARVRFGVAVRGMKSADEALRITRERYARGDADISELLNAESALIAARTRRESARYEFFIAESNRKRAHGVYAREESRVAPARGNEEGI